MGNKISCCVYSSPKGSRKSRKEDAYVYQPKNEDQNRLTPNNRSAASLPGVPHISERENYPEVGATEEPIGSEDADSIPQTPTSKHTRSQDGGESGRSLYLSSQERTIPQAEQNQGHSHKDKIWETVYLKMEPFLLTDFDEMGDPTSHPTIRPIFPSRSQSEINKNNKNRRKSQYDNRNLQIKVSPPAPLRKYSSCSTIFIDDSTVSQPNLKNTIKAVAFAIYFHIRNRDSNRTLEIFDEKIHPLSREMVPDDYDRRDPEHKQIYRFVRTLFSAAQLTAECAIVTLVYLERLLHYAEIDIMPANWKRIVLGAILLASKVWDDQAVWNVDYCQILKDIAVEDMNDLERQYLEMLQFNINVPSSVYAKYYFDLRALADANDLSFPLEPLSKDRALKLEAMSNEENLEKICNRPTLTRSNSLDGMTHNPRLSAAIIS